MSTAMPHDELAEINGIKPKVVLGLDDERRVEGSKAGTEYSMKRKLDHYYCTCLGWRMFGGPVDARTCKHLKALLGEEYEIARVKSKNPSARVGTQPPKRKRKAIAVEDEEVGGPKEAKKSRGRRTAAADDGEDEEPKKSRGRKSKAQKQQEEEEAEGSSKATSGQAMPPPLLLANKWDINTGRDPTGYWMSEKLDGIRTLWNGKQFLSRLGNVFTPPKWFSEKLPKNHHIDGELWAGRGKFSDATSVVRSANSPHWQKITFQIFDIPSYGDLPFEERIEHLKKLFGPGGKHSEKHFVVLEHEQVKDGQHVLSKLKEVEALGGEGLMLRKPGSMYEYTRSSTLLKVKTFFDAEAVVIGYTAGKGKYSDLTGGLECKTASGKVFRVGSGMTDRQRTHPPKIGTIITYRFQELTKDGVPRFPTFIGEAVDKSEPKDVEVPKTRIGKSRKPAQV